MFCKVALQNFLVQIGMFLKDLHNSLFEPASTRIFAHRQNRTKRHMQKLTAHDFIQIKSFVRF